MSPKALSNVVVKFADGERFAGDREIVTVWVKAGNNVSGDGPGYGERFEADADCDGNGGTGGTGGTGATSGTGGTGGVIVY